MPSFVSLILGTANVGGIGAHPQCGLCLHVLPEKQNKSFSNQTKAKHTKAKVFRLSLPNRHEQKHRKKEKSNLLERHLRKKVSDSFRSRVLGCVEILWLENLQLYCVLAYVGYQTTPQSTRVRLGDPPCNAFPLHIPTFAERPTSAHYILGSDPIKKFLPR